MAENELSEAQKKLSKAKRDKAVVDWFLDFTKDKINE